MKKSEYNSGGIVALRNEKGSYNGFCFWGIMAKIVALRNEKGSYNLAIGLCLKCYIVALRNEKGSYNLIERKTL